MAPDCELIRYPLLAVLLLLSAFAHATKLESGPWRLFYDSTGFYSLEYERKLLLQDPYSWLPIIDGKVEVKREKDTVHLIWTDVAPQRHPSYTTSMELLLGATECELTWRLDCHQQPKGMELAVFLPDEFFRSPGRQATCKFALLKDQEGTTTLTDSPGIPGAGNTGLAPVRLLTLSGDRRLVEVRIPSGAELGYGWYFQDYRKSKNAPGCYRLVFAWDGSPLKAPALALRFRLHGLR